MGMKLLILITMTMKAIPVTAGNLYGPVVQLPRWQVGVTMVASASDTLSLSPRLSLVVI